MRKLLRSVVSQCMMEASSDGYRMTKAVTFRLDEAKIQTLDELAAVMDRDRSFLLTEAVDDYLDVQRWQLEGIDRAIAEADAGKFATPAEVKAAFEAFKNPLSA